MPDFTIEGNPGAIRSRASGMRSKAKMFEATGDGLSEITTDGWRSRAGDRFRDKFEAEPRRWWDAGQGFTEAGLALEVYAGELEQAKQRAAWCKGEYARGEQVSADARSAYDADVSRAKGEAKQAAAAGQVMTLTILPFHDPGAEIRQHALSEFASAKSDLKAAAHTCASGVRGGCAAAPEERKWYEKVGAAVGGVLMGAGEALVDLGKLAYFLSNPAMAITQSMMKDAASGMTSEEIAAKYKLKLEDAKGMLDALQEDPVEFGKNLGKGLLDWDTWADDPARAVGHLVPDAIAAVLTAGTGTAATRGVKGTTDALDALADMAKLGRLDDVGDLRRLDGAEGAGGLDDVTDALTRYDDVPTGPVGTHRTLDDPELEPWLDQVTARHPELDRDGVRGTWDYTTDDGYTKMNGEMRNPTGDPVVSQRVDAARHGLDQLPGYEGTTYRGTNLPQSVVDHIDGGGRLSDGAFSSSSRNPDVAENFINHAKDNPTRITVEGHSGVNVSPFSAARGEAEILFQGGREFDVVTNVEGEDGVRNLVVREVR